MSTRPSCSLGNSDGARRPSTRHPGSPRLRTTAAWLARVHWVRVAELTAGEPSGLFAMEGRPLRLLPARGRPRAVGGSLGEHRPPGDAVRHRPRRRGRGGRAGRRLAPGLRVGAAPGRAGPGEPDAHRGSRTAPASPPGRRAPRVARGARGGARTQPRRTDGIAVVMLLWRDTVASPRLQSTSSSARPLPPRAPPSRTTCAPVVVAHRPTPTPRSAGRSSTTAAPPPNAPAGQPWSPPPGAP